MKTQDQINRVQVFYRSSAASLGFFVYGYTIGIFNSSLSCISTILQWGQQTQFLISLMSGLVLFGGSCGAVFSGYTSKVYGKRLGIISSDILMIAGSILCTYPNTISFGIGRFLCGFASGCFSMLCPSYINEFTPSSMAASMGSLNQIFLILGILISNCICMGLPLTECGSDIKYRVFLIFLVPVFVCFLQLLLFIIKFKLESPSWFIIKGQKDIAIESAASIYTEQHVETEIERMCAQIENGNSETPIKTIHTSSFKEICLCAPKIRKSMRVGILIHVFQQLSGINGIMFYSTMIYQQIVGSLLMSRVFTIIGTIVRILALVIIFPFINRINKKKLSIYGALLMSSCFFILIFTVDYNFAPELNVVIVFIYLGIFTNTVGQVPWFYSSLIMPDKGVSLAAGFNFLTGMTVVLSFPFILDVYGIQITFIIYCILNIVSACYFLIDMVDCSNMNSYEIRRSLSVMK